MKNQYIQAVTELLKQGLNPDVVFANLKRTLEQRGHTKLHAQILTGTLKVLARETEESVPHVVIARTSDEGKLQETIKRLLTQMQTTEEPNIVVDPTIIGGFTVRHGNTFIDHSFKKKLLTLYRSIIIH